MKKLFLFLIALSFFGQGMAQNPFAELGYQPRVATASNGKFNEFHDQDSVVRIGSVLFNVNTRRIVGFVKRDSVASETSYEVDVVSRWISPDPLSEMRNWLSPYNFVQNNPIIRIDPDGRLDDWVFNQQGNFLYVERNDDIHRIKVVDNSGTVTENRVLNDQVHDQRLLNELYTQGYLEETQFVFNVDEKSFNQMMGHVDKKSWGIRHLFAYTESTGGVMDFAYQGLGKKYLDKHPAWGKGYLREFWQRDNSDPGIFFLFQGNDKAYNFKDAGNFMWGNGMKKLGFSYGDARYWSLWNDPNDPEADQQAIKGGYDYNK